MHRFTADIGELMMVGEHPRFVTDGRWRIALGARRMEASHKGTSLAHVVHLAVAADRTAAC